MTHFGENTKYIDHVPVNLMLPSDLTKTVSILYYGPPKFQSYEDFRKFYNSNPRKKTYTDPKTLHKIVINTMRKTLYNIPILINFKGEKVLSTWHRQGAFIFARPKKIFVVENALYFPIGIVKMRKDASFWRFLPLKFLK